MTAHDRATNVRPVLFYPGMFYHYPVDIKKNFSLILGICIPILMILFVAGSIYLPGLFIQPHVNFLYVSGDDYSYGRQQYSIQNEQLVKNTIKPPAKQNYSPPRGEVKLFIYDVAKNESREVSLDQARSLHVDPNTESSDGFEVVYGSRDGGFFPFFFESGSDYHTRYLKGHNVSIKLNLQLNGSSYYNNFRFLGWIQ